MSDREREDAQREYRLRVLMGEPPLRAAADALPAFRRPAPPRLRLIQGGAAGPRPRPAIYIFGRGEGPIT